MYPIHSCIEKLSQNGEMSTDSPPMSARRLQTRQRLMDAAVGVFAEKGIEGASVEEISEAAGFTRGAFYSNFDSKDALCFALQGAITERFLESVQVTVKRVAATERQQMAPADLIDLAIDTFLTIQPSDRPTILLLMEMQLYALRHPDFAELHTALQSQTLHEFSEVLSSTLADHGLSLSLPTDQVVDILHAVHHATQANALLRPSTPSPLGTQLKALLAALLH
mgnify:CR=1 FL=1